MDKPKKISISFYLNKQLKDRQFNGKSHYPVYARVLFNQMSNRLPFTTTFKFGFFSEEEFNSFVNHRTDPVIKAELKDFEQTIERIIRFEYGIQEEKFKLVGLKEKLISYQQNMLRELEIILNRLLISHLGIANIDPNG
ncbi:MAG: hypothetical protein IPN74_20175 [Haliscomenobacter sp.]|nr:hypothetical protein [Haliscomenobacter sp.]